MSEQTYLLMRKRILQHIRAEPRTNTELESLCLDQRADAQERNAFLRARDDLARSGQISQSWPGHWALGDGEGR